jgi:hypothetical protein
MKSPLLPTINQRGTMNTITINAESEPINPEKIAREYLEQYDREADGIAIYFSSGNNDLASLLYFQYFGVSYLSIKFYRNTDLRCQIIEVGLLLAKAFGSCELRIRQ